MLATALAAFSISLAIFPHETRAIAFLSSSPQLSPQAHEENQMRSLKSIGQKSFGVLSSLAIAAGASAQDAVQWRLEDGGNGHWYQFDPVIRHWPDARAVAEGRGGHMATVTSSAEQLFARAMCPSCTWLGGVQSDASCEPGCGWTWTTGEAWGFTAWRPSEPNNRGQNGELYVALEGQVADGGWNDAPPYATCSLLIEWSADCNSDGIVDFGQIRAGELVDANANNVPDCCEAGTPCRIAPIEWSAANGGNGHWYAMIFYPTVSRTFDEAQAYATSLGAHLATVTSANEDGWLKGNVVVPNPSNTIWGPSIGGRLVNGKLTWVTGELSTYAGWGGPEPTLDGPNIEYWRYGSLWWNDYCDCLADKWLFEWSADCNADGIVDYGQIRAGELEDANGNNIPDCCEQSTSCEPCAADIDGSGTVNAVDLAAVLTVWGTDGSKYPNADIDGDGEVNGPDLAAVLSSWGACP
jgi:hypothetical protein